MKLSEITKNKEWYLCKYKPVDLGGRKISNPTGWEYGMVRYHAPYGESFAVEICGPSFNAYKLEITQLPEKSFTVLGSLDLLANGEATVATKVHKIIEKLELPPLDEMNSILPAEPIDVDWLNSDISNEEILKVIPIQQLKHNLIKYMMYASYVQKIINLLVDIEPIVNEEESSPSIPQSIKYGNITPETKGASFHSASIDNFYNSSHLFVNPISNTPGSGPDAESLQVAIDEARNKMYKWATVKEDDIADII